MDRIGKRYANSPVPPWTNRPARATPGQVVGAFESQDMHGTGCSTKVVMFPLDLVGAVDVHRVRGDDRAGGMLRGAGLDGH